MHEPIGAYRISGKVIGDTWAKSPGAVGEDIEGVAEE